MHASVCSWHKNSQLEAVKLNHHMFSCSLEHMPRCAPYGSGVVEIRGAWGHAHVS